MRTLAEIINLWVMGRGAPDSETNHRPMAKFFHLSVVKHFERKACICADWLSRVAEAQVEMGDAGDGGDDGSAGGSGGGGSGGDGGDAVVVCDDELLGIVGENGGGGGGGGGEILEWVGIRREPRALSMPVASGQRVGLGPRRSSMVLSCLLVQTL